LGELIGLSALLEDKGDVSEALRLRVRAVDEARALLGGDPKSNWYAYQHVVRSHHDLARMYGKAGDRRREFEELREYFLETEPYVHERDHSQLLAETAEFTPANLDRLRAEEKRVFGTGSLKRFTISADFDGVKQPVHVYVADSWQFLADQFTWVERVRGGKVPRDVVDSFRRVYDTARQRRVSYRDLCVYELGQANADDAGPADAQSPVARRPAKADPNNILPELAAAKQAAAAGRPAARRQLALRYARLAEDEVAAANYFRAGLLLDEARSYADLDALGAPRDPKDRDLLAYIQYVHGALLAGNGEPEKGYSRVLESFRTEPEDVEAGFALPAGAREFALGWISLKLQHPAESAGWYHKAMELGHGEAAERLYRACDQHPDATRALPSDLCKLLARAKASATNDDPAPLVFARLAAGGKGP
jgi:hypothetical protein